MKKMIVSSSVILLLAAGSNSFAAGGPKVPKIRKAATQIGKNITKVAKAKRAGVVSKTGKAAQTTQARQAVSKSNRATTGLTRSQAGMVERAVARAQQPTARVIALPGTSQEGQLITKTLSSLDKKADEYICTFGFVDGKMQPIYKEDGAFASIGDGASVAEVEARIRAARQARPNARYLVLQARKPFAALPRVEMPEYLQGSALYEENLPRVLRNLREYVYDLKDNTLISVSEEVPQLPSGTIRFVLDGLE